MFLKCTIVALCVISCLAKFPPDVPRCRVADLVCIPKVATEIIQKHPGGRPDLGLPPIDPYIIYNVTVNEQSDVPISLKLFIKRAEIHGLSHVSYETAKGWKPSTAAVDVHELLGTLPKLELKGDYKADGTVLSVKLNGEGEFHLILENIKSGIKFQSYLVEKNGLHFLKIKKIKVLLEPSNVKVKLTNLLGGNKEVEDSINAVLNENWQDAWTEIAPAILDIAEKVIKDALQKLLDKNEFDDFYLPD